MICGVCGRKLKDTESIERGYGPVCYGRIMPAAPKKAKAHTTTVYNCLEDVDYNIPGQMELSDFIEMPKEDEG